MLVPIWRSLCATSEIIIIAIQLWVVKVIRVDSEIPRARSNMFIASHDTPLSTLVRLPFRIDDQSAHQLDSTHCVNNMSLVGSQISCKIVRDQRAVF